MSHNDPGEETHQVTMLQHCTNSKETNNKVLGCLGLECKQEKVKWAQLLSSTYDLSDITDIIRQPVQQECKAVQVVFTGHLELLSY